MALRQDRAALRVQRLACIWLHPGDVHRPCAELRVIPALSAGNRRHRRIVRHHAIPHISNVLVECRWHGERDDGGLGEYGRRRNADGDAAGAGGRADVRRWRDFWVAAGDGCAGRGAVLGGNRVLLPDAGRATGQLQGAACEGADAAGVAGAGDVPDGGEGLSRVGAVRHLWRMLRGGADYQQYCGAVLL